MIVDILSEIFSPDSSFGERVVASFMALLMLAVVALIGLMVFILVDQVGVTASKTTTTVVEAKQTIPAHSTTSWILAGKVMVPMTTYHPESYHLQFTIAGNKTGSAVNKSFFDDLNVGDLLTVDYGYERLSGGVLPINIRRID